MPTGHKPAGFYGLTCNLSCDSKNTFGLLCFKLTITIFVKQTWLAENYAANLRFVQNED